MTCFSYNHKKYYFQDESEGIIFLLVFSKKKEILKTSFPLWVNFNITTEDREYFIFKKININSLSMSEALGVPKAKKNIYFVLYKLIFCDTGVLFVLKGLTRTFRKSLSQTYDFLLGTEGVLLYYSRDSQFRTIGYF